MGMDLTGILNQNEYYTNHYFSSVFEENASDTISAWRASAKEDEHADTPWALLRSAARAFYPVHDRYSHSRFTQQTLSSIRTLADVYLKALGYPQASPLHIDLTPEMQIPVYLEVSKPNGAPLLWVLLSAEDAETGILEEKVFDAAALSEPDSNSTVNSSMLCALNNEELATKILFSLDEPPRFLVFIGLNQIALIDRNKWNEKRHLQFDLEEIFSRREETTLQAMAVLLHKDSLCPSEGTALIDELDANSQKHAAGVSQDLKYALRECIELLGNEVLYDMAHRQGINLAANPVDPAELTIQCLRYMYRMLFVLFIEARPELGYAPIRAQSYLSGYSLESLRDIADSVRDDVDEVGEGYFLYETLSKLYDLIYTGYPKTEEAYQHYASAESLHDVFIISPLKAHIFDPEYTALITKAKIRNCVMLRIVELMSLTRPKGRQRPGRISYANLGINQLGAVYEALLSYRGFIAEEDLYEVKRAGDKFNELDVGYFVKEADLDQYTQEERVRTDDSKLRMYPKGTFVYRLAGREREKSASYFTPEVLTKCLVKYALKELLEGKTADEILQLTICEPAMGSAAFLNEAINQLSEAYLDRKQKELGETIPFEKRFTELQKVKMLIADRNVYGIDLNPVAVELAEVSLWLNTIYEGGYVPWFGLQLVNGNSLIGARRQCYRTEQLTATTQNLRWYENAPERVPLGTARMPKKQVYHFLAGDPGMCSYNDAVIKKLEPDNIKKMKAWNKEFTRPFSDDDLETALRLSKTIDTLWEEQIKLRKEIDAKTSDPISVYGQPSEEGRPVHTTIREKDRILREIYKSEEQKNAGPYARLKFAMDYWCALWFWPIDKADLLPSRMEFLSDMGFILEGTIDTFAGVSQQVKMGQMSLFPSEADEFIQEQMDLFGGLGIVNIPQLCALQPRLALVRDIAEQNRFMHWELEFADLFADRGGFDLCIGNPPWIKLTWYEQDVLSDYYPIVAIRNYSAAEIKKYRDMICAIVNTRKFYLQEYESIYAEQAFLNAVQNYLLLKGQSANLYKCFLPQGWYLNNITGINAYVHPDGVFDDPNGKNLRTELYLRLKAHYSFRNEKLLFDISHSRIFSLNIYGRKKHSVNFDFIGNLFDPLTIDLCYDHTDFKEPIPLFKNINGQWEIKGHKDRIIVVTDKELMVFARLFDGSKEYMSARLPVIHARQMLRVLELLAKQPESIGSLNNSVYFATGISEPQGCKQGIIERNVYFPRNSVEFVYSGAHIGVANPVYKTSRRNCKSRYDFDPVDVMSLSDYYLQRCNYKPEINKATEYFGDTPWGSHYICEYRIVLRRMLNIIGERTLIPCIIPPGASYIDTVFGFAVSNDDLFLIAGTLASLVFDFYVKITAKSDCRGDTISNMPCIRNSKYKEAIAIRAALLNCVSQYYADSLWRINSDIVKNEEWCKRDSRLKREVFTMFNGTWKHNTPLRTEYERRQALIEIDVLTAMSLEMSLNDLCTIYKIQFPTLQKNESDTWYDSNGNIVFTCNPNLPGIGYDRKDWESGIKGAPAGKKFYRTITDDTMPGGPVERTIEYVAPFDRCDREQDYETAWKFFEEKYGKVESNG